MNMAILGGNAQTTHFTARVKPIPYASTRLDDQSRFEDEAPPTEDDMISKKAC